MLEMRPGGPYEKPGSEMENQEQERGPVQLRMISSSLLPWEISQDPPKPLHLLLHTLNLRPQSLDKSSQFRDLVLGVFEVIPMPAGH